MLTVTLPITIQYLMGIALGAYSFGSLYRTIYTMYWDYKQAKREAKWAKEAEEREAKLNAQLLEDAVPVQANTEIKAVS
jgi:hypothetical protein